MPDLIAIDEFAAKCEGMDDESVLCTMLAALDCLLADHAEDPGTENTVQAARAAFGEIAIRWIPQAQLDAAVNRHMEASSDAG